MNIKNLFKKNKKSSAQTKKLKPGLSEEIANIKTAAAMYSFANKILNPDEVLTKTGQNISIFSKLENEGQVAACIDSRNAGITSLKYRLKYEDEKYKDFFEDWLKNADITGLTEEILKAVLYGYAPIEIMWEVKDGYIIPQSFTGKPQEWFYFNNERQLCYDKKGSPEGYIIDDSMMKFIVPRHKPSYKNPYGKSLLARCFWSVAFKKGSIEFWVKFAEKYGMPFMYGKYEQGMDKDEIDKLLDSLEAMVQDAVGAIPDNSTVEILDSGSKSSSSQIYKDLIEMCDKQIAINILGQSLTTDTQGVGSQALGNVHYKVRGDLINSDKKMVETNINKILKWITVLNFGEDAVSPEIEFYSEEGVKQELAQRDKVLSETGVKFTKKYFMKTYSLEEEDFEIAQAGADSEQNDNFSESKADEFTDLKNKQAIVDKLAEHFTDEKLSDIVNPKIQAIIDNFKEDGDINNALEDLSILYPENNSKTLEETLAQALFLSELAGSAKKDDRTLRR